MKAQAADGLGELINITSAEALKPSVVNITGPLIRILGDRFSWQVKVAVLETLTLLLAKVCSTSLVNDDKVKGMLIIRDPPIYNLLMISSMKLIRTLLCNV